MDKSNRNRVIQQQIQLDHIDCCLSIWRDRMAPGYEDRALLEEAATHDHAACFVALNPGRDVVGFSAGKVGVFSEVTAAPYSQLEPIDIQPNESVVYLNPTCVDREYEGRGIGSGLRKTLIEEFTTPEQTIVTEIWHREGVDGRAVNVKFGFECVQTHDQYWRSSSGGCGECPECNETPCTCSGGLYVLTDHPQAPT